MIAINGFLDITWSEARRKCPRRSAVVFRYVPAASRDCRLFAFWGVGGGVGMGSGPAR